MNKISIILSSVAILLAGYAILFNNAEVKLAYVDTNKLIETYRGTEKAKIEYQKKATVWQANIDTLTQEFQRSLANYKQEKTQLTTTEQKLKEELLQNKQRELNQYQQAVQQKAREEDQKMMNELLIEINKVVKTFGKEKGFKIILGANGSFSLGITLTS